MAKTIDFNARAEGVLNAFEKIQQKSKELFNQEVEQAQRYATSSKEQIRLLEERAKAFDRLAKQASQAAKDFSSNFETNKANQISDIEKRIKNNIQRRKEFEADYKRGDYTASEYTQGKKEISKEYNELQKEKESLGKSKIGDSPEYRSLKEQERNSRLLYNAFRENLETSKSQGKELAKAITNGDREVADEIRETAPNRNLVEGIANTELQEREKRQKKEEGASLSDLFGIQQLAKSLIDFSKTVVSLGNSQNGFDQIANVRSSTGNIVGSILGGVIGSLIEPGGGTAIGAGIGGSLGSIWGGGEGNLEQRGAILREQYQGTLFKRRALTGEEQAGVKSMAEVGLSPEQYSSLITEVIRATGRNINGERNTNNTIYFEKAFGVAQNTSMTLLDLLRSSKEGNRDLGNLMGGVLKAGERDLFKNGDRTFFNEFLSKNFSTMQRELLKTQNTVASGTTMDILQRFNSVGGPFEARDSRSGGLISTIQNSLVNPGSDVAKAMSFDVLRRLHPGQDVEGIIEQQQQGLSSPGYLKAMIARAEQSGGSEGNRIMSLAGLLGLGNNLAAARKLYESKGNFDKNFSLSELSSPYSMDYLKKQSEANTTTLDKNTAKITEAVMKGVIKGAEAIKDAIEKALDNSSIEIVDGRMKVIPSVKENLTYKTGRSGTTSWSTDNKGNTTYYNPANIGTSGMW